jgi:oligoribonuclease NrnB/cAMP/cGMP phosphodiesterase (DHH superfamily)
MYEKIIIHDDFDGIVSGAICSLALGVRKILFAGPSAIIRSLISISENDIVCDLPYPLECGLWFDHHEGNLQDLEFRKIDPADINGRFAPLKSCARVVYEYFSERTSLPEFIKDTVEEADIIDSFGYSSIEEWRAETPGKIIDSTLKIKEQSRQKREAYMRELLYLLKENSIEEVASLQMVKERFNRYKKDEEGMLKIIKDSSTCISMENDCKIVLLDLTNYNRRPILIKNLAYLLFPDASAVLQVANLFERGVKTRDLSFSMSLSLKHDSTKSGINIGEVMRTLNIGDGHRGAGAGTLKCNSKQEMIKKKAIITDKIFRLWNAQLVSIQK